MVNLLGRRGDPAPVADLAPALRAVLQRRLGAIVALARIGRSAPFAASADALAAELEELETSPSRIAAEALLDAIDRVRRETLARYGVDPQTACDEPAQSRHGEGEANAGSQGGDRRDAGLFVCHRPGRSLATGEAEIASRSYFDVQDRPPLDGWIGVLPVVGGAPSDADFWIVAWVSPADAARARAGCRACPTGALVLLESVLPALEAELSTAMRHHLSP